MAFTDLVILSSSPPRQIMVQNMSSSPQLPSPTDVFKKDFSELRSGSRVALSPENVPTTSACFTPAGEQDAPKLARLPILGNTNVPVLSAGEATNVDIKVRGVLGSMKCDGAKSRRKPPNRGPKDNLATPESGAKKAAKPPVKKSERTIGESNDTMEVVTKKPRAKRKDKAQIEDVAGEVLKEMKARKPKATKADTESQSKLSNGKVTKSISRKKTVRSEKASETENVDWPRQLVESDNLGLIEAVRRRVAWTPPAPTAEAVCTIPCSADVLNATIACSNSSRTKGLSDLLGTFGFTSTGKSDGEFKATNQVAMRKRKLIELVRTSTSDAAAQPREKTVKKKAKTITDQATSMYAAKEGGSPDSAPLLQFFSCQTTSHVADGFKVPSKPRKKIPVKMTAAANKKSSANISTLLSPESAMKHVDSQNFVFGTSSQLAREESPTFLKNVHEAMQASNEAHNLDLFSSPVEEHSLSSFRRGKAVPSTKGMLWSAASRGTDGGFLDVEMIDLSESPVIPKRLALVGNEDSNGIDDGKQRERPAVHNLSIDLSVDIVSSENLSLKTSQVGPIETAIRAELLSSPLPSKTVERDGPRALQPKSRQIAKSQKPTPSSSQVTAPKMPDFTAYTTVKLAKEIASYHFKPVKSRQQMIALLQKCWEGKHRTALSVLNSNFATKSPAKTAAIPLPNPEQETPKRARGRPRKDSTPAASPAKKSKAGTRSKNVHSVEYLELDSDTPLSQVRTPRKSRKRSTSPPEEIYDSETALTPSPPRRHASQIKCHPLPLPLKRGVEASPELSEIEARALLFKHITKAILYASPSQSTENLSWHEKILLYDPIVLEDLAAWLNTGAMEKVGWDGEVAAWDVKKWCESKSICCLWKETLRGGARSRY